MWRRRLLPRSALEIVRYIFSKLVVDLGTMGGGREKFIDNQETEGETSVQKKKLLTIKEMTEGETSVPAHRVNKFFFFGVQRDRL